MLIITIKNHITGASLVAQWLRIRLPMQGTWVRALVWEDSTCRGATKPMCCNYWACESQLLCPCATTTEAHVPKACALQREATTMRSPRTAMKTSPHLPQLEKARTQQQKKDPTRPQKKRIISQNGKHTTAWINYC